MGIDNRTIGELAQLNWQPLDLRIQIGESKLNPGFYIEKKLVKNNDRKRAVELANMRNKQLESTVSATAKHKGTEYRVTASRTDRDDMTSLSINHDNYFIEDNGDERKVYELGKLTDDKTNKAVIEFFDKVVKDLMVEEAA